MKISLCNSRMLLIRLLDHSYSYSLLVPVLMEIKLCICRLKQQILMIRYVCAVFNDADNESILLETGCHMVLSSLKISDKANLLSLMIDYHCIIKPKAAIDQFVEGLSCSGAMHYVEHYPDIMKLLFCQVKSPLTAS